MKQKLSLGEAIADLGWFSTAFAAVVGGPSVVSLLQMIFVEHRLVDALQWIVDGYNDIVAVIGAVLEPVLTPAIAWLNALLDWRLELQPHWKPLLMLVMTFVIGMARSGSQPGRTDLVADGVTFLAMTLAALLAAAAAGLVPLDAGWWAQGLAAGAPWAVIFTVAGAVTLLLLALGRIHGDVRDALFSFVFGAQVAALAFALGAGVSFVPGLRTGAGLIASALALTAIGLFFLSGGLRVGDRRSTRLGLTLLGGFVTAALIVAADVAVKLLS